MLPRSFKTWLKATKFYSFLVERFVSVGMLWLGMWFVAYVLPALYANQTEGEANTAAPLPFKAFLDFKLPVAMLASLVAIAGLISIALLFVKEVEGQQGRLRELLLRLGDEFSSACTHLLCGTSLMYSLQHGWAPKYGVSTLLYLLGAVVFFRRVDGGSRPHDAQPAVDEAAESTSNKASGPKD